MQLAPKVDIPLTYVECCTKDNHWFNRLWPWKASATIEYSLIQENDAIVTKNGSWKMSMDQYLLLLLLLLLKDIYPLYRRDLKMLPMQYRMGPYAVLLHSRKQWDANHNDIRHHHHIFSKSRRMMQTSFVVIELQKVFSVRLERRKTTEEQVGVVDNWERVCYILSYRVSLYVMRIKRWFCTSSSEWEIYMIYHVAYLVFCTIKRWLLPLGRSSLSDKV